MAEPYSDEVRAQVLAALLAGQSVSAVAREYNLSRATVKNWRDAAGLSDVPPVSQQKMTEIGDLLLGYLNKALHTLQVQADHFADKDWLAKQPAGEAAVLHGVITDKAIRLLEALHAGADTDAEEDEGAATA